MVAVAANRRAAKFDFHMNKDQPQMVLTGYGRYEFRESVLLIKNTVVQVRPAQPMMQRTIHVTYKAARRIVIGVVGSTVVILGLLMFIGPGPGLIVFPLGLAILGLEFAWARLWLRKLRRLISNNSLNGRSRRAEAHRERVSK